MPLGSQYFVNASIFVTNKHSVTGAKSAGIYICALGRPLLICWSVGNKDFGNLMAIIGSKFSIG
jgi:hypothetical protein